MERYAWKARVRKGCLEEYIKRHDNLWESIQKMFQEAGITNYTIWSAGEELFGYYECQKGVDKALETQKRSQAVLEWNAYMKDVLIMEMDEKTGGQPCLRQIFCYEEKQK